MIKMGRVLQTIAGLTLTLGVADVAQAQVGNNSDVLNPNLASADEMTALPHMTAEIANTVVEHRPYLTVLPLNELLSQHLSGEQRADLYTKLFVPINLNSASEEEILLVPGVGARMAHEFDEYRPYRALAQFRREIGKYVDDEQVAAYEQFVFVPIDLNSASDEDILSIPGVGNRLLHEFKEYRPYRSIEQFRRGIGKYVNDDEIARLERYVYIGG
jgi:DNA uptake protein ComE-like DNA-binding protein